MYSWGKVDGHKLLIALMWQKRSQFDLVSNVAEPSHLFLGTPISCKVLIHPFLSWRIKHFFDRSRPVYTLVAVENQPKLILRPKTFMNLCQLYTIFFYQYKDNSIVNRKSATTEQRNRTYIYLERDTKTDDRNKNYTHPESVETEEGNKTYTLSTSYFSN